MQQSDWIYDWNLASPALIPAGTRVLLNDETLRDGLQNPSVYDPGIGEKIRILHLMESLGIDSVNIGLPGAGARAVEHVEALAREIATNRMKIRPNCAARTLENDILDRGSSGTHDRECGELRGEPQPAFDVRDGRYGSNGSRDGQAALFRCDSKWSASDRVVRHSRPRNAARRVQPGQIRDG